MLQEFARDGEQQHDRVVGDLGLAIVGVVGNDDAARSRRAGMSRVSRPTPQRTINCRFGSWSRSPPVIGALATSTHCASFSSSALLLVRDAPHDHAPPRIQ